MRFFTTTVDGIAFTTSDREVAERLQAELLDAVRHGPRWVALPDGERPTSVLVTSGTTAVATTWTAAIDEDDDAEQQAGFVDFDAVDGLPRLEPPLA